MTGDKSKVEYLDFKSLSKEKQEKSSFAGDSGHSNPKVKRFFKFFHKKLNKFKPDDLM